MLRLVPIIAALLLISLSSCWDNKEYDPEEFEKKDTLTHFQVDSINKAKALAVHDTFPEIRYKRVYIKDYKQLQKIKKKYRSTKDDRVPHKIMITLNRKEMRYFRIKDTIIVPDTIYRDIKAYSVFPQFYWEARDIPKIIVVSNAIQAYACYEKGKLVRFAACNSGKERTPTYPGRYALVWKERVRRSSLDSNWVMPYTWNFHAHAGNAFHKFTMPGRPVSHSCVRQFMTDAEWLYYWGRGSRRDSSGKVDYMSGTPVIILDIFDYTRKRYGPWMELKSNKSGIVELPAKPMEVEEALIPWCQIPDASKGSVNRQRFLYAEDTLRARGIIRKGVKLIETVNFNKLRRDKARREAQAKLEQERKDKELLEKQLLEKQKEEAEKEKENIPVEYPDKQKIKNETFIGPVPVNPGENNSSQSEEKTKKKTEGKETAPPN